MLHTAVEVAYSIDEAVVTVLWPFVAKKMEPSIYHWNNIGPFSPALNWLWVIGAEPWARTADWLPKTTMTVTATVSRIFFIIFKEPQTFDCKAFDANRNSRKARLDYCWRQFTTLSRRKSSTRCAAYSKALLSLFLIFFALFVFEFQTNRVDAEALLRLAGFCIHRTVVENMAEMRPAGFTDDFGAMHAMIIILA